MKSNPRQPNNSKDVQPNIEFKLEAYKELRCEFKDYQLLTQKLWTYKFAVIGAVISIAVFNDKIMDNQQMEEITQHIGITIPLLGILILPLLSLMIDFKLLQLALHVKRISDFIAENFKDIPIIKAWEVASWSGNRAKMIGYIEVISSVGTSILILTSCFTLVGFTNPNLTLYLVIIGLILLVPTIIAVLLFYPQLWKTES